MKFSKHASYRNTSYDRLKSEKSHFSNTGKILLKQGFKWVTNIHEHKRYYYTFDNFIYYLLSIQNTTPNLSTLNHNVRFLPCQHRGVGIAGHVYALNPVCIVLIIPDLPPEKFPVGTVDIVNPGIQ